jgi:hypothetical protein
MQRVPPIAPVIRSILHHLPQIEVVEVEGEGGVGRHRLHADRLDLAGGSNM